MRTPAGSAANPTSAASRVLCPTCNMPARVVPPAQLAAFEALQGPTVSLEGLRAALQLLSPTLSNEDPISVGMEEAMLDSSAAPTSADALKSLRRVRFIVDGKGGEDWTGEVVSALPAVTTLRITPGVTRDPDAADVSDLLSGVFECVVVPATFSGVIPSSASGDAASYPIVLANPATGVGFPAKQLVNIDQLKGSTVLMDRGDITFASKSVCAETAGAASLLVVQGPGREKEWPLQMVDSGNELSGRCVSIPVVMVSHRDGDRIKKAIHRQHLTSCLSRTATVEACPVCVDAFHTGDTITFLPCQHLFHDTCISPWLTKRNTCPLCRYELPVEEGIGAAHVSLREIARQRQLETEREAIAQAWYA
jgi:hypothetical protein